VRAVADRYADALADVALSQENADQVRNELASFVGLLRESPELRAVLESPAVSRANKRAAVEALVARMGASRTLRNFLLVVVDRRRTALLPEMQRALDARLDERMGITRAEVTSARGLDEAARAQLRSALERLTGGQVEARYEIDPALIAGAVVRVHSTIYDGSVRTQLERLRARLASA
jgi:F-type H+-transporting ATPase subunit delta